MPPSTSMPDAGSEFPPLQEIRFGSEYVRHTFGLLVTWFTFFVALNYATMGWLSRQDVHETVSPLRLVLPVLFIGQGILGVMACRRANAYLAAALGRVHDLLEKAEPG